MNQNNKTAQTVKCPACRTPTPWLESNPHRPFCSEQCRNRDFIGWANEEKVIAGSSAWSDVLSGDVTEI